MAVSKVVESICNGIDTFIAWGSQGLRQSNSAYIEIQTADSPTVLVSHSGNLASVIEINGSIALIGNEEFQHILKGIQQSLQSSLQRDGSTVQVHFDYSRERVLKEIEGIYGPSKLAAKKLNLSLEDVFQERLNYVSKFCAHEKVYVVLWTKMASLSPDQQKKANEDKGERIKAGNIPPFQYTQNVIAAIPDLRDAHDAFARAFLSDLINLGLVASLLPIHDAMHAMRLTVDSEFTDPDWKAVLPGDQIHPKIAKSYTGSISDVLWPSISHQLAPRDIFAQDLKTCRVGDLCYSSVYVDLFPKDLQPFMQLFSRILETQIPWRISFLMDGNGIGSLKLKRAFSSLLSFSSSDNRLINDACALLDYVSVNNQDAVIKLRVVASTWAEADNPQKLRTNAALLSRAMQGWGSCDISEICGDPVEGFFASALGVTSESPAVSTVAILKDALYMMPFFRSASPWKYGSMLFRTPDGKPWPYQPGSALQTTWIDLVFARPGSGKSVLSNALNLSLVLAGGNIRLPRIAIIDIGPSSSGLISLLKESLPMDQKHLVAYHRLRMTPEYSINPFDTQLGVRFPTPQERSFLVNFLSLLVTPVGAESPYDGVGDMAGMVLDEVYKSLSDDGVPNNYSPDIEPIVDSIIEEIGFVIDMKTTWWEVTDALFVAGFAHEATLAQRHASPLLNDVVAVVRTSVIEDLFGKVVVATGESLVNAFVRMLSSSVREYPILSKVTQFDIGHAKIVSLDLDEVAKGGGGVADRQTAVMYMLARYVMVKDYYLNTENFRSVPEAYLDYHQKRAAEIKEDHKRIVYDEFHRTSKSSSVRNQVLMDMREGRKWGVQIGLISQSIEDFDEAMVEFGTSIFIMDAGPEQTVRRVKSVFGLSSTATHALKNRVHGPRFGGATFLAQFSTKNGLNTQLLTLTLGPNELWAFSTTNTDANLRNQLYIKIGPREARRVLSTIFPSGTASQYVERQLAKIKDHMTGMIDDKVELSAIDELVYKILAEYKKNPNFKKLSY